MNRPSTLDGQWESLMVHISTPVLIFDFICLAVCQSAAQWRSALPPPLALLPFSSVKAAESVTRKQFQDIRKWVEHKNMVCIPMSTASDWYNLVPCTGWQRLQPTLLPSTHPFCAGRAKNDDSCMNADAKSNRGRDGEGSDNNDTSSSNDTRRSCMCCRMSRWVCL